MVNIKFINNASHNDDPYADYFLLNIDSALKDAKKTLTEWQNSFTELANSSLVLFINFSYFFNLNNQ
jgi:hypothetical protein